MARFRPMMLLPMAAPLWVALALCATSAAAQPLFSVEEDDTPEARSGSAPAAAPAARPGVVAAPQAGRGARPAPRKLLINGRPATPADLKTVARIEASLGARIPDGSYWYDARSGLWGSWGGPVQGLLPPGLALGGPLPAGASGGATVVFINGRCIHPVELAHLQRLLGAIAPGRYWLDSNGNAGLEGGPPIVNLYAVGYAASRRGGRSWTRRGPGGGMGSDGNTTYFIAGNSSVIVGP